MELGLDFDDSDFTEKVRQKEALTSYNAKVCYPEWFFCERADNGRNDMATVYKFRGDYHFQRNNLKSAIECYKNSLENLGIHNRSMRRELTECLARCHMMDGDFEMSQTNVEHVMSDCLTIENYCNTLMLQQQLYRCSGNFLSELNVLYQLINLHPVNVHFWLKLVDVFERIRDTCERQEVKNELEDLKRVEKCETVTTKDDVVQDETDSTKVDQNCSINSNKSKAENIDKLNCSVASKQHTEQDKCVKCTCSKDESPNKSLDEAKENKIRHESGDVGLNETLLEYPVDMILLTCYVRARLILLSVQGTVGSFIKDKNLQLVDMLNCKIKDLKVQENILDKVTQFIRRDMYEEESDESESKPEQNQDVKAVMEKTVTSADFNTRRFSWIKEIP